jgi:hypothetical protein
MESKLESSAAFFPAVNAPPVGSAAISLIAVDIELADRSPVVTASLTLVYSAIAGVRALDSGLANALSCKIR